MSTKPSNLILHTLLGFIGLSCLFLPQFASADKKKQIKYDAVVKVCKFVMGSANKDLFANSNDKVDNTNLIYAGSAHKYYVRSRRFKNSNYDLKITLLQEPRYGKLKSKDYNQNQTKKAKFDKKAYIYYPNMGFSGKDYMVFQIESKVGKIKVFYWVMAIRGVPDLMRVGTVEERKFCLAGISGGKGYTELFDPKRIARLPLPTNRHIIERYIGRLGPNTSVNWVRISPNARRIAYAAKAGRKWYAVVDGKAWGRRYDAIGDEAMTKPTGAIHFSPDGKRIAYIARERSKWFVVLDGKEGKRYKRVGQLVFSPDGKRFAYLALEDKSVREGWFVVADSQEGKRYDSVDTPVFSPDSKQLAYAASDTSGMGFLVIDGERSKRYKGGHIESITFSPDSKRLAYVVAIAGLRQRFAVIDGEESEPYNKVGRPVFSPDSKRVAYSARTDTARGFMVVDGKKDKTYHQVQSPVFNSNGTQIAYRAEQSVSRYRMVVNGKESELYHYTGPPVFSPDSMRVAYTAWLNDRATYFVINGKRSDRYDAIAKAPVFSLNSMHVAYAAKTLGKWFVIVDGQKGKPYDRILGNPVYGLHGIEGYDITKGMRFSSAKRLHYFAIKNNGRIYRVEERLK